MGYLMVPSPNRGGTQSGVDRIVIHATVSPCERGGARNIATYFSRTGSGVSAHYVVDPGEVVQCVPEDRIAWHDGRNVREIGIELCDPMSGPGSRWRDVDHEAMLRHAAKLVREVAGRWGVPLRRITYDLTVPPTRGVCGHADVSKTWHCSDHTDPGTAFPWDHFMALVTEEDDLPYSKAELTAIVHDAVWKDVWPVPGTDQEMEAWEFLQSRVSQAWLAQRFSDLWQQALANDADAIAEKVAAKAAGGEVTKELVQEAIRELVAAPADQ